MHGVAAAGQDGGVEEVRDHAGQGARQRVQETQVPSRQMTSQSLIETLSQILQCLWLFSAVLRTMWARP